MFRNEKFKPYCIEGAMKTGIFTPPSIAETQKFIELFDSKIYGYEKNSNKLLTANVCGLKSE